MLQVFAKLIEVLQLVISLQSVPSINRIDLEVFQVQKKHNLIAFVQANGSLLPRSLLNSLYEDMTVLKSKSSLRLDLPAFLRSLSSPVSGEYDQIISKVSWMVSQVEVMLLISQHQGVYHRLLLSLDGQQSLTVSLEEVDVSSDDPFQVHILLRKQKIPFDQMVGVLELNRLFGHDFEMSLSLLKPRLVRELLSPEESPFDLTPLYCLSHRLFSFSPQDPSLRIFLDCLDRQGLDTQYLNYHCKQVYMCAECPETRIKAQLEANWIQTSSLDIQVMDQGVHWQLGVQLYAGVILEDCQESLLSLAFFLGGQLLSLGDLPTNQTVTQCLQNINFQGLFGFKLKRASDKDDPGAYQLDYKLSDMYKQKVKKKIFVIVNYEVSPQHLSRLVAPISRQVSQKISLKVSQCLDSLFGQLKGQYKNKYLFNRCENTVNQSAMTFIPLISSLLGQFYQQQGLLDSHHSQQLQDQLTQKMTIDLLL